MLPVTVFVQFLIHMYHLLSFVCLTGVTVKVCQVKVLRLFCDLAYPVHFPLPELHKKMALIIFNLPQSPRYLIKYWVVKSDFILCSQFASVSAGGRAGLIRGKM